MADKDTKSAVITPPAPTPVLPVPTPGPHLVHATFKNEVKWSGEGIDVIVRFSREFDGPMIPSDIETLRVACTQAILMKRGKKIRDPLIMADAVMEAFPEKDRSRVLEIRLARYQEEHHGVVIGFER